MINKAVSAMPDMIPIAAPPRRVDWNDFDFIARRPRTRGTLACGVAGTAAGRPLPRSKPLTSSQSLPALPKQMHMKSFTNKTSPAPIYEAARLPTLRANPAVSYWPAGEDGNLIAWELRRPSRFVEPALVERPFALRDDALSRAVRPPAPIVVEPDPIAAAILRKAKREKPRPF